MDIYSKDLREISEERELMEINGGNPWVIGIGVVAGVGAILDYGYDFVQGFSQGYKDNKK